MSIPPRIRVLVVDEHEISRGAYCALLRTEGLEPLEVEPDEVLAAARALDPDVVLIDAGSWPQAARLYSLPGGPAVIVVSSAQPESSLDGVPFLPKGDICARAIRELIADELFAPTESQ